MQAEGSQSKPSLVRALSLLCIVLVAFTGFVQAVHFHPDESKLSSHDCSICSVAHAAVLGGTVYHPVPFIVRSVQARTVAVLPKSSGYVFSIHIRPPPTV